MDVAIKMINFIRLRAKNHRLYQLLTKEMGVRHMGLLFYTKVCWLSRAECIYRLYKLQNEVKIFLRENKNNIHVHFHNKEFVVMLAYLADVFSHLNDMNVSLQGRDVTVSDVKDKLAGLTARMGVWQARIKLRYTTSFQLLERRLKMNGIELPDNIKNCIIEHLEILSAELRSYFNNDTLHVLWLRDLFNTEISPNAEEAEELAEFKVLHVMKLAFYNKTDNSRFWLSFYDTYSLLSKKASVILVQFPTTYLCKAGFSDLASIKTKSTNRLNVCSDIRLAQSKTEPNIKGLLRRVQEHASH